MGIFQNPKPLRPTDYQVFKKRHSSGDPNHNSNIPMKTLFTSISILLSTLAIAQPTVSGSTSPSTDITILLPKNSVTLTGTAMEANPGHPILDTTWTETSGPSVATITNPSNRMNTTVTGLVLGTYKFTLTATDKKNAASSAITITVMSGVLPITLASFNVTPDNGGLLLTWQTNTESNNAAFIVQTSNDGSSFTDVATIASQAPNGNSNAPLNYSYQVFGQVVKTSMDNMLVVIILLAGIGYINKLKKIYKGLLVTAACLFFFSCSKSVTAPLSVGPSAPPLSSAPVQLTEYRLKIVDRDGNATYSQIKVPF
jgi:hypothetical protein